MSSVPQPLTLALEPARSAEELLDIPTFIEVREATVGSKTLRCAADENPQRCGRVASRRPRRASTPILRTQNGNAQLRPG